MCAKDLWFFKTTQCCQYVEITDNGANVVAAVHKAGQAHYPHFVFMLKDSTKALPDLVNAQQRRSATVAFFDHSTRTTENLKDFQKLQSHTQGVFYMLESLFELKKKKTVTTVLQSFCKNPIVTSIIY